MNIKQLSFMEPIQKTVIKPTNKYGIYDATICSRCCCNRCKYSVEIYPFLSNEECMDIKGHSCFNCDECYYYGMDDESLNRTIIKYECEKFEMSDYYSELEAKTKRKTFKMI